MSKQIMSCLILVCSLCSATPSFSAEDATLSPLAQQAKSIVKAAHAYVLEHSDDMDAVQKVLLTDPRFRDDGNGLYVFLYCYNFEKQEAICCGHGTRKEFLGKNMWNLKTPNGRMLFRETSEKIEENPKIWIEYEWLHPMRKIIQTKKSYIMRIVVKKEQKAFIGCGFWK